jgi:hypothetical protein
MDLTMKSPVTYACARLCVMVMQNVPEIELNNANKQEEFLNFVEKSIQDFVASKAPEKTMHTVAKKVSEVYQWCKKHCSTDSHKTPQKPFPPYQAAQAKTESTHYIDRVHATVKINLDHMLLFNEVFCRENHLYKFHAVKASIENDKLTLVFFRERSKNLLPLLSNGGSGLKVCCKKRLFKDKIFLFDDAKKNMRLPYKFVSPSILKIRLPTEG